LAAYSLEALLLFLLDSSAALVFFLQQTLLVHTLFLSDLGTASIVLSNALVAGLFVKSESLLALILVLLKTPLPLKLLSLALQALFLKLSRTLLLGSLSSECSTLGVLLLEADALSFFLLLAEAVLALNLLSAQAEFLSVALGLQTISFLELALVEFSELGLDLFLIFFGFALQTGFLLLEGLLANGLLSLVLFAVGLTHGC
jgi:hypothetical protein